MPSQKIKQEAIEVKLVADENLKIPYNRFYSNFIYIQHTMYDFSLRFCDMQPIYDIKEIKDTKTKPMSIVSEAVVPAKIIPGLVNALIDSYNKYQEAYGDGKKIEIVKINEK